MCFVSEATGSALVLSAEALQQHLGAVLENAFHPTMDEPSGQQITQFAPHQFVVEYVVQLNTPCHFLEMVLMVPKGVGPNRCSSTKYARSRQWVISVTHVMGMLNKGVHGIV